MGIKETSEPRDREFRFLFDENPRNKQEVVLHTTFPKEGYKEPFFLLRNNIGDDEEYVLGERDSSWGMRISILDGANGKIKKEYTFEDPLKFYFNY